MVNERTFERCEVCGGDLVKTEGGCSISTVEAYRCIKCGHEQRAAEEVPLVEELDEIEKRMATADVKLPIQFTV